MKKILFSLLLISGHTLASSSEYLTLYFIPSPKGMDWSSPANLAWSALKNKLTFERRFMGHVYVEFQCNDKRELTGMVGKKFDYLNQLLLENRGLGILYHSFAGRLESQEMLDQELSEHLQAGKVNFITFKLNPSQCSRISTYLEEYRKHNVGRYYGLANRPLHGEGAGCSAFGASFLDVSGIMNKEFQEAWSNSVNIPMEYAGPPLQDKGVNLIKLMLGASSWAKDTEEHKKLTFWDPDLMHRWVKEKVQKANDLSYYQVEKRGSSEGVVMDKSHLPAPQQPIWKQNIN
jgi:hypothetical protein